LTTVKELRTDPAGAKALLRADSAFCGRGAIGAAVRAGAQVSVTVRLDKLIRTTIAAIPDDAWTTIQYTDAVFDEAIGTWISRAEVAEVPFPAFAAGKKTDQVPGRLVAGSPNAAVGSGRRSASASIASTSSAAVRLVPRSVRSGRCTPGDVGSARYCADQRVLRAERHP